jgi:phage shock protein C
MYCSSCGIEIPDHFRFCSQCGASTQAGVPKPISGPLRRSRDDKKIAGVCAGLGRYLGLDITLVRILVLCAGVWGVGVVFYVICWIAMPQDPLLLPPAPAQHQVTNSAGV